MAESRSVARTTEQKKSIVLTTPKYLCPKCGTPHSVYEFSKSRFCRKCGKFLTDRDKRTVKKPRKKSERASKLIGRLAERIENTYELIQRIIPYDIQIDSLEVVKQVEEYRQFWQPRKTNVVLLAESHVYTDEHDYEIKLDKTILHRMLPGYPLRFIRFVYCLGYGENELLSKGRTDRKNAGTPQYWKIFSSCVAENEKDLGFWRVLKTETTSLYSRLRNKVGVLRKMKRRGIWLLDASIVGLYGSGQKNYRVTEKILEICWKNIIASTIKESNPRHIIVIGKGVGDILNQKLCSLGIPFSVIPQPQARGSRKWQLENYKKYQRICSKNC